MNEEEKVAAEQAESEDWNERIMAFRKSLTQREKKAVKLKMDDPDDVEGATVGMLWVAQLRKDPKATFDNLLDLTDDELLEELGKHIPLAPTK